MLLSYFIIHVSICIQTSYAMFHEISAFSNHSFFRYSPISSAFVTFILNKTVNALCFGISLSRILILFLTDKK